MYILCIYAKYPVAAVPACPGRPGPQARRLLLFCLYFVPICVIVTYVVYISVKIITEGRRPNIVPEKHE